MLFRLVDVYMRDSDMDFQLFRSAKPNESFFRHAWSLSDFAAKFIDFFRLLSFGLFKNHSSTNAVKRNRRISIKIEVRFRFASSRSVTARAHVVLEAVVKSENWPIITHTHIHSYRQRIGTMARRFESVSNGRPQLEFELFTI